MIKLSSISKAPIFVIGNPRSGTTLLRLMLTSHPAICIPPECGWLVCKAAKWKDFAFATENIDNFLDDLFSKGTRKIETWHINKEDVREYLLRTAPDTYRDLVGRIYTFYARSLDLSVTRWGDKNNFYLKHILDIARIFPNAKFLHIIRDPRGVAASYMKLAQVRAEHPYNHYVPALPSSPTDAVEHWRVNIEEIQLQFSLLSSELYKTIRYEDLLYDPKSTLKSVCKFIHEPYSDNMLNFYQLNSELGLEPQETLPWKRKTLQPVDAKNIYKWEHQLSWYQVNKINELTKELRDKYGYI